MKPTALLLTLFLTTTAYADDEISVGGRSDLRVGRNSALFYERSGDPSNPAANGLKLYAKDDGGTTTLYTKDSAGTVTEVGAGGGSGTSVLLDLEDDGGNDSTALEEIAISGDTNAIFTESADDKLLVDLSNNWPSADTADALSANGTNASAGNAILGVDASGNAEGSFDVIVPGEIDSVAEVNAIVADGDFSVTTHTHGAATLDTDSVSADELNAAGVESELEAVLDLESLQGAVTDSQVPDDITVDLATAASALAANGANASAGQAILGVDASGAAEGAFDVATQTELDGLSSVYQPLDADLTSIAGNTTGGFVTRTAADTYTPRTITGTANEVTVTNGDGVSGAPTISLPNDITVTSATVDTEIYNASGWDADNTVPTKDAVRDKFESLSIPAASGWTDNGATVNSTAANDNFVIGSTSATAGTSAQGVLVLVNNAAPTTSPVDSVQLYSEDAVSSFTADQIPDMTNNTSPSGVASASSEHSAPFPASAAMTDDSTTSYWLTLSGGEAPSWLKYDFGSGNAKTIVRTTIQGGPNVPRYPTAWTLEGSNNDSAWTTLDTQSSQTFTAGEVKTFTFSNSTAYRYYRINISASGDPDFTEISEWELMEATSVSAELRVRNEAGDITTLSPHNFSDMPQGVTNEIISSSNGMAWSYHSEKEILNLETLEYETKSITVDMFGAIRAIEELTGKQLIYTDAKIPKPSPNGQVKKLFEDITKLKAKDVELELKKQDKAI